jgi:hypothetical protein
LTQQKEKQMIKKCRDCQTDVSEQALTCPKCGCPYPGKEHWTGWGFEYKSKTGFAGLPWIHISFKYRANRTPVVAKGIIAIGQFGMGIITIAQFGIGVFSLAQFALAGFAIAQFAAAYSLIAQFGLFLQSGRGSAVYSLADLVQKFFIQ